MSGNVKNSWTWTGWWQLRVLRAEGNGSFIVRVFCHFYFCLLCSFVRGFAYLKQPMLSLKGSILFAIKLWFVSHPKRKQSILALYSEFGTYLWYRSLSYGNQQGANWALGDWTRCSSGRTIVNGVGYDRQTPPSGGSSQSTFERVAC